MKTLPDRVDNRFTRSGIKQTGRREHPVAGLLIDEPRLFAAATRLIALRAIRSPALFIGL